MSTDIPGPAYRIETERLVLRCWNPVDAPLLAIAVDESLEHLYPWMPWAKDEPSDMQTRVERMRRFRADFDRDEEFIYGAFDLTESKVLGGCGLHCRIEGSAREIGYWIHKDHINKGLATELSAALTKIAFEIDGVDRVEIHMDPKNLRSAAVPRKLGYRHEATLLRRTTTTEGLPRDTMIWTLFAHEYPDSPAAGAQISAYDAAGRQLL